MTAETIRSADWWQTELPHCVKIKSQKESAESHLFWYWTQSPSHQWIFKQIDKKANPFTTTFTHSPGHTQVTKHSSLVAYEAQHSRCINWLCKVLKSIRWMQLVTRRHISSWPRFPSCCENFFGKHTMSSCGKNQLDCFVKNEPQATCCKKSSRAQAKLIPPKTILNWLWKIERNGT